MNTKLTAIEADLARASAIHAKLARLQQLADDHFGQEPHAIHWGHVKNDDMAYSEYRTKRVVLEIFDSMAEAARSKSPYKTLLDP